MESIGFLLDVLGKVLVSWTAIAVHVRFRKEHKIDKRVFTAMRREHVVGLLGILLIIVGSWIEYVARF
ncbi:MAG: hypothetical protein CMI52_04495 [Parcubacteria group bacterium]|nr:hypothetical protein [Parcubacteria group bacterium]|tara:strand:- start:130 stop:333 length:204 start_codon:yes stop_codon:yes gene_type:complete